jgi:hypothetical protein
MQQLYPEYDGSIEFESFQACRQLSMIASIYHASPRILELEQLEIFARDLQFQPATLRNW